MPDLFPRSILADPKGFKTVIHEPGYFPPALASGWRTSILRPYTVTYSYDAILTRRSQRKSQYNEEDELEINGNEEMEVEVHRLAYMPPNRSSGWHTSTLPNYIVTYCWDSEPNVKSQDDENEDQESTGNTDPEAESQGNKGEETSSYGSTDFDHELSGNTKEEETTGGTDPEPDSQDNREEEKSDHTDSTDWNKELRGVENAEKRITGSPDSESEQRQPYRPKPIGPREMLHIYHGIHWLDPAKLHRAVEYLEMERPGLAVSITFSIRCPYADFEQATGAKNLEISSFSRLTLSKIHDLVMEWQFEDVIDQNEREATYRGTDMINRRYPGVDGYDD